MEEEEERVPAVKGAVQASEFRWGQKTALGLLSAEPITFLAVCQNVGRLQLGLQL
jgi:hypothetical protein